MIPKALAEIEWAIEAWLAVAREEGLPIPESRYRAPPGAGSVRALVDVFPDPNRHCWSRGKCLRRVETGPSALLLHHQREEGLPLARAVLRPRQASAALGDRWPF